MSVGWTVASGSVWLAESMPYRMALLQAVRVSNRRYMGQHDLRNRRMRRLFDGLSIGINNEWLRLCATYGFLRSNHLACVHGVSSVEHVSQTNKKIIYAKRIARATFCIGAKKGTLGGLCTSERSVWVSRMGAIYGLSSAVTTFLLLL